MIHSPPHTLRPAISTRPCVMRNKHFEREMRARGWKPFETTWQSFTGMNRFEAVPNDRSGAMAVIDRDYWNDQGNPVPTTDLTSETSVALIEPSVVISERKLAALTG